MAAQRKNSNGSGAAKTADPPTSKPVWSRRFWTGSGHLEVAVWSRTIGEGDEARETLNTTLKKTYKADGTYKESASFRPEELGIAILALQEAAHYISEETHRE